MQVKKQKLELDMKQQTGSKSGKEYIKAVYCHTDYLTFMQSTSSESTSWNQGCRRNTNNLRYADDTTLWQKVKRNLKSLLMKVKEESEKVGLRLNIQKTKLMASSPILRGCVLSRFSCVCLFVTPWTVAHQAPLSMGFCRQEYWSGLSFPSPGIFPTQRSNPGLLHCRHILHHLSY